MKKKETRMQAITPVTIPLESVESGTGKMIVEGYAAVFNERTQLFVSEFSGYSYLEEIAQGAFAGADMARTVFKYNHEDSALVLARASNGTLSMNIDDHGLRIRAEIADTSAGRDVYELIRRGDLGKMSFAFTVRADDVTCDRDKKEYIRRITEFDTVYDVSVVDFPAYEGTAIEARSGGYYDEIEERLSTLERRQRLGMLAMC